MSQRRSPRIFISYRRADSATITGRIYDRLAADLGRHEIFKDVDNIPPGSDFRAVLQDALQSCRVSLVIIGRVWLDIADDKGNRRIDDPADFVRLEVQASLQRGDMLVIPVLVEGASMPGANALPEDLRQLAFCNAIQVRNDPDFHRDMDRLIEHLKKVLAERKPAPPRPAKPPTERVSRPLPKWIAPLIGVGLLVALLAAAASFAVPLLQSAQATQSAARPTQTTAASTSAASIPTNRPQATATTRPSATPASVAANTGQQQIAYDVYQDGNSDIYVANVDGTDARNITRNSASDASPAWSPDGARIAFESYREFSWDIYVMNADGSNVRAVTSDGGWVDPSWSPDGTQLVVGSYLNGNNDIYLVNANGGTPRNITNSATSDDYQPDWSPDGTQILFVSNQDERYQINVINTDGSNLRSLTAASTTEVVNPTWSPNGTQILFQRDVDINNFDVFVMDADGNNVRNVTNNCCNDDPAWSPNGRQIVFASNRDTTWDLYVMNIDGSGVQRLTNDRLLENDPDWSP